MTTQTIGQCPSNWLPSGMGGIIPGPHCWSPCVTKLQIDTVEGYHFSTVTEVYCMHCQERRKLRE